jgi:hypothetical protein
MRGLARPIVAVALTCALVAGCGTAGPEPECDAGRPSGSASISCQDAVSLARARLPGSHAMITRVQFLYGDFRPILPQVNWPGVRAYVVFTFAGGSRQAVPVTLTGGTLTAGSPQPY